MFYFIKKIKLRCLTVASKVLPHLTIPQTTLAFPKYPDGASASYLRAFAPAVPFAQSIHPLLAVWLLRSASRPQLRYYLLRAASPGCPIYLTSLYHSNLILDSSFKSNYFVLFAITPDSPTQAI